MTLNEKISKRYVIVRLFYFFHPVQRLDNRNEIKTRMCFCDRPQILRLYTCLSCYGYRFRRRGKYIKRQACFLTKTVIQHVFFFIKFYDDDRSRSIFCLSTKDQTLSNEKKGYIVVDLLDYFTLKISL